MKKHSVSARVAMFVALSIGSSGLSLYGADGTWTRTNTSSASWDLNTNWLDNTIADGVSSVANFTALQGGTGRTITLNDFDRTVGVLNVLNQHSNGEGIQSYTFSSASNRTLTFDNGLNPAQLNIQTPSYNSVGTNTFSVGIRLGSSLNINNARPLAANSLTLSGPISASSAGTKVIANISTGPADLIISGAVSDGSGVVGILQNSASSLMVLSGSNTFTGGVTINAGSLSVSSNENLGAASGTVTFGGGTLVTPSSTNFTANRATTLNAGGGTFQTNSGGTITWNGIVSGGGALTKSGAGTLVLGGTNTYTGGTTVSNGTLRISSDANLGASSGALTVGGGTVNITANTTMERNIVLNGAATFTINSSANTTTVNGNLSGSGAMTKGSAGRMILNGTGTNTGGISQTAGTLLINGDFSAASGAISVTSTVGAPSTFGGAGTVGGNTSILGASSSFSVGADSLRDAPNSSTGLLTFSDGGAGSVSLTLSADTTSFFELGGDNRGASVGGYDAVDVQGLMTYAGILNISLINAFTPTVNQSFILFNTGSYTGTFSDVVFANDGLAGNFDYATGTLTITAIPEPTAAWILITVGLAFIVLRRRRMFSRVE